MEEYVGVGKLQLCSLCFVMNFVVLAHEGCFVCAAQDFPPRSVRGDFSGGDLNQEPVCMCMCMRGGVPAPTCSERKDAFVGRSFVEEEDVNVCPRYRGYGRCLFLLPPRSESREPPLSCSSWWYA